MLSRRRFLQGAGMMSAFGASGLLAGQDILRDTGTGAIQLEQLAVPIKNLPSQFGGYKIGFITDLHLGIWVPERWIVKAFELVQSAGAEMLVLGGDYIGLPENPWWESIGAIRNEMFAGIPRDTVIPMIFDRMAALISGYTFKDGMIAVPGNHEHWNSTRDFLKAFGHTSAFKLLMNEPFTIRRSDESLTFFGTDDFLTGIPRLPHRHQLPEESEKNRNILISHNPDLVSYGFRRDAEGFPFSLSLSGHTHGGQVCLPGIGPLTYQVNDSRFGAGLLSLHGKASYTSRGLGVVAVPFRLACPPEVTVIELVPE